jgi:hypothetical protein
MTSFRKRLTPQAPLFCHPPLFSKKNAAHSQRFAKM